MARYLAIASSTREAASSVWDLELAQVGMLERDRVYTYVPNFGMWVENWGVEESYIDGSIDSKFLEIPEHLAKFLVSTMRPFSSAVAAFLLEEGGDRSIRRSSLDDIGSPARMLLSRRHQFREWADSNGLTEESFLGFKKRTKNLSTDQHVYLRLCELVLSSKLNGNTRLLSNNRTKRSPRPRERKAILILETQDHFSGQAVVFKRNYYIEINANAVSNFERTFVGNQKSTQSFDRRRTGVNSSDA